MFDFQNYKFLKKWGLKILSLSILIVISFFSYEIFLGFNKSLSYLLSLTFYLSLCCLFIKTIPHSTINKKNTVFATLLLAIELLLADIFSFFIFVVLPAEIPLDINYTLSLIIPAIFTYTLLHSFKHSKILFTTTLTILLLPIYYPFISYLLNINQIE